MKITSCTGYVSHHFPSHSLKKSCISRMPNLFVLAQTYFMTLRMCMCRIYMWMHTILCINAHETFACTNANYGTENPGQNIFQFDDLDLWPMALPIKLVRDVIKVNPCIKFRGCTSVGSAVRVFTRWHTDTHTDASVFITSTADAEGKKKRAHIMILFGLSRAHAWLAHTST